MHKKRMSTRLRELVESPRITVAPSAHTALHALMIEKTGFEAMHITGEANWLRAWPNAGVLSWRDYVDNAARIAHAVNIPALADLESGFGNAVNVWYAVREYISAGVGGLHLEDQELPQRSGTLAGRRLVSVEEAVGKFRAAMDAKKDIDPDFVICARTDARGAENGSLEEAIRRATIYKKQARVDLIFIEGLQSWEECKIALREVPGPAFCVLHDVINPYPTLEEQEAAGQAMATGGAQGAFYANAANQVAWEKLHDFKRRGVAALVEWRESFRGHPQVIPSKAVFYDMANIQRLEREFLPPELRRNYEDTVGRTPDGGLNRPASGEFGDLTDVPGR